MDLDGGTADFVAANARLRLALLGVSSATQFRGYRAQFERLPNLHSLRRPINLRRIGKDGTPQALVNDPLISGVIKGKDAEQHHADDDEAGDRGFYGRMRETSADALAARNF